MYFFLRNPKDSLSLIYCKQNKKRISTGIKIPTRYWDGSKQRVQRGYPLYKSVNEKLKAFTLPQDDLVLPFYESWATKGTATKTNPRRGDRYRYRVFAEFASPHLCFSEVTYKFYTDFLNFLQDKGLSANSQGTQIRDLKAVMNEAYKQGLHENMAYKTFKKPTEETDSVYLTEAELDKIRALKISGSLEKVRDLFLLGCNTGMRFSDYSRLSQEWIKDGQICFISKKTKERQVIPLSEEVAAILAKYNGYAPKVNPQRFNTLIKDVCRAAEINDLIQTVHTEGREKISETKQKWEMVSSHTARRTAASLLVKRGAPIAWVMNLTGHKTEAAFWKYVRLTKEEYSDLLKKFIK